jgi:hypothetical protein
MTELLALALANALGEGTRSRQAHLRTLQTARQCWGRFAWCRPWSAKPSNCCR